MLKPGPRTIFTFFTIFLISSCIDPYSPKLNGYESILVVDGLITDENSSYSIVLSRTIQDQNAVSEKVNNATVYITSDKRDKTYLEYRGNGVYKTDSIEFKGFIGTTYVLHILTSEGLEYESEPCFMRSVNGIDSLYIEKYQELVNNGTETNDGIMIYLDSESGDDNQFYRWDFEETWKFKVPTPKKSEYINENNVVMIPILREYCWKSKKSDKIIIQAAYDGQKSGIKKEPIFFIATDKSDRLLLQYSINVNQYSISKEEYQFWNYLKQTNNSVGDIFAKQPFPVTSNIHNINNPEERVLGYFQVSSVKKKRLNILLKEIVKMDLPLYSYNCERIVKEPADYTTGYAPPVTWDELYGMFCIYSDYYFVEPLYFPGTTTLHKMVFATPECANCELTGTSVKPDFWVDLY